MQEPKARKDMDPRYLWDLSSIIESAAEFERQFKEAQAQVSAFSTWQGHVGENPRKAIREAMEMNRLLERLLVYAAMYADQDGGDSQAQDQLTRARSLAGVDMEDPATVQDALKVFADTVDQLEALL